jgi:hypothetical protein
MRPKERIESELPSVVAERIEEAPVTREKPLTLKFEPHFAMPRSDSDEPHATNSKTERFEPNRVKVRTLKLEPQVMKSVIDT